MMITNYYRKVMNALGTRALCEFATANIVKTVSNFLMSSCPLLNYRIIIVLYYRTYIMAHLLKSNGTELKREGPCSCWYIGE